MSEENKNIKSILQKIFFKRRNTITVEEKIESLKSGYEFTVEEKEEILKKNFKFMSEKPESLKDSFEFISTNKNIQNDIMNYIKPRSSDYFSYQNLNIDYGVYSKEANIFATVTYFMSSCIRRDDNYDDDYKFIIRIGDLEGEGVYFDAWTSYGSIKDISPSNISISIKIDQKIKENIRIKVFAAILALEDYNKENDFRRKQEECNPDYDYYAERKKIIEDYMKERGW